MLTWVDRSISLQAAYSIADGVAARRTADIFRAMDRMFADYRLVNEDSRDQRDEAIKKLAIELDARNVPVRDPAVEEAALQEVRKRLGFSLDGNTDLYPDQAAKAATACQ